MRACRYGQWEFAEEVDDVLTAVMDAYDAGADWISVTYQDDAA